MNVSTNMAAEDATLTIAAAIGEPARARMLFCLADGRARTATELVLVAEVSPSTASAHLSRLKANDLVRVVIQGKHRYYRLESPDVASVLEGLSVLAGRGRATVASGAPDHLRAARSCYDHIAGTLGVSVHDRLTAMDWIAPSSRANDGVYDVTAKGAKALNALGIDIDALRTARRRFAFGCLDWTERRAHVGGALGAALLTLALERKWVSREHGSRALQVTASGRRAFAAHFGVHLGVRL